MSLRKAIELSSVPTNQSSKGIAVLTHDTRNITRIMIQVIFHTPGSVAGAKASAAIYSVMISTKLNGYNEYAYLRHLLEKLPIAEKAEEIEAILPHRLKPHDLPATTFTGASPKSDVLPQALSFALLTAQQTALAIAPGPGFVVVYPPTILILYHCFAIASNGRDNRMRV